MNRYIVAESWPHIFEDRRGEELVRFVLDWDTRAILAMDVRSSENRPWTEATAAEIADVKEELETTDNLDYALQESEVVEIDEAPGWASDRVEVATPSP